jgi:hypothetical protein
MKPLLLTAFLLLFQCVIGQELYQVPKGVQSKVSSFENKNGRKGEGGKTNKGAKGNAFEELYPGNSKELLNIQGKGIIQRIWLTVNQSPRLLRSLHLQMFWDGSQKPAVDVPLGDFFASNLGRPVAFQSAFFSSPEGRSFNCYVPMPFQKGARVIITNESARDTCKLFYDIDFIMTTNLPAEALYFHASWRRQITSAVGEDFLVLPTVNGKGRFLGMSVGLNTDSVYDKTWWGEGEVKMYLDGDKDYPTINGTGAEDYIGTGWGMGSFSNLYQGAPVADEAKRQFVFYRWHIPDAIYFNENIKVTLQQIGGGPKNLVKGLVNNGYKLKPITIDAPGNFVRLLDLEKPMNINDANFPEGWVNFYRVDDYSAVSYFYLDKPSNSLPPLPSVNERIK